MIQKKGLNTKEFKEIESLLNISNDIQLERIMNMAANRITKMNIIITMQKVD